MSGQSRIAEVLRERFKYSLTLAGKWIDTGPEAVEVDDLAAEIVAALHPRVETAEDLDALPEGSIIEAVKGVPEVKWNGRWYAMTSDAFEPDLPARVIYSPTDTGEEA